MAYIPNDAETAITFPSYTKTTWENHVTPLSETNMRHLEDGIYEATQAAHKALTLLRDSVVWATDLSGQFGSNAPSQTLQGVQYNRPTFSDGFTVTASSQDPDFNGNSIVGVNEIEAKGFVALDGSTAWGKLKGTSNEGVDLIVYPGTTAFKRTYRFPKGTIGVNSTVTVATTDDVQKAKGQAISAAQEYADAKFSNAATFGGNVTIAGNLTVQGNNTVVDSTTLSTKDVNIELAKGNAAALTQVAGFHVTNYDGNNHIVGIGCDSSGYFRAGLMSKDPNGALTFHDTTKEIATRAVHSSWSEGTIAVWDANLNYFKNSGKTLAGIASDISTAVESAVGTASSTLSASIDGKQNKLGFNPDVPDGTDKVPLECIKDGNTYYSLDITSPMSTEDINGIFEDLSLAVATAA